MAKTKKQDVRDYIICSIKNNQLRKGDQLDSESALARQFHISRMTVRQATSELIDEGIIYRINGSGLFVGEPKLLRQTHYHELTSFNERAKSQGMTANRKVISINIEKADEKIARELNLKNSDYVYHIVRLMKFDDIPITIEDFFMPVSLFPNLNVSVLEESKYKYVENSTKRSVHESLQVLKPVIVEDKYVQHLLGLTPEQPVMCVREITYLIDGTPFEVNTSIFNSNFFEINQIAKRQK